MCYGEIFKLIHRLRLLQRLPKHLFLPTLKRMRILPLLRLRFEHMQIIPLPLRRLLCRLEWQKRRAQGTLFHHRELRRMMTVIPPDIPPYTALQRWIAFER